MAKIKPFRALRYTAAAGAPADLCCPPYDIISEEQRRQLLQKNSHNLVRLELPRTEHPYRDAAVTLRSWLDDGLLAEDAQEGLYIYEEAFSVAGRQYALRGFIALVRLSEFSEGIVLPHEETLSKAKQDRFDLMTETGCSFSQIYSLYRDEDGQVRDTVNRLSAGQSEIEFTDGEGVTHRLWSIYDPQAQEQLAALMADKKLYIADGHHRYETALNFARANARDLSDDNDRLNYCMMMLVDMENSGLVVFPTHRVLHSLPDFDAERALQSCSEHFDIRRGLDRAQAEAALANAAAADQKAFIFYAGEDFCLLTLKDAAVMRQVLPDKSDAYRNLDVSVLHSLLLERLFGIDRENMANQKNLFYTRIADEAVAAVDGKKADCCFLINATRVDEIRRVAAAGEKMPQKSTYFYPKLITGLVMNDFRPPKA